MATRGLPAKEYACGVEGVWAGDLPGNAIRTMVSRQMLWIGSRMLL
jgi:hypothetical protein